MLTCKHVYQINVLSLNFLCLMFLLQNQDDVIVSHKQWTNKMLQNGATESFSSHVTSGFWILKILKWQWSYMRGYWTYKLFEDLRATFSSWEDIFPKNRFGLIQDDFELVKQTTSFLFTDAHRGCLVPSDALRFVCGEIFNYKVNSASSFVVFGFPISGRRRHTSMLCLRCFSESSPEHFRSGRARQSILSTASKFNNFLFAFVSSPQQWTQIKL